jgi:hypothetical protein
VVREEEKRREERKGDNLLCVIVLSGKRSGSVRLFLV